MNLTQAGSIRAQTEPLSQAGLQRLARHVVSCTWCLLALMVPLLHSVPCDSIVPLTKESNYSSLLFDFGFGHVTHSGWWNVSQHKGQGLQSTWACFQHLDIVRGILGTD